MARTLIKDLPNLKDNQRIEIRGWMHRFRDLGRIGFIILRDRTGFAQIVVDNKNDLKQLRNIHPESVLYIRGDLQKTNATELGVEIINPTIKIVVPIKYAAPINFQDTNLKLSLDTQIQHRTLLIRNPKYNFMFKIQGELLNAFRDAFRKNDFTEFRPPTLLATPSESGADVFEVNFFDKDIVYLAQSPQFYKQIMLAAFERVFSITPVFRAEKHNTSRHLLELTQIDGEMGFIDSYLEIPDMAEKIIKQALASIIDKYAAGFEKFNIPVPLFNVKRFPILKVKEALQLIEKLTGKSAKREKLDLEPDDERILGDYAKKEFKSDFIWIINFHANKNPYTYDDPENPDESLSFDLLFKGLEVLSGTKRIHDYEKLKQNLSKLTKHLEYYHHYLEAMKYGMPPEGGFSFGLERLTQQLFNLQNIKEATLFPTDLKRVAGQPISPSVKKS